MLLGEILMQEGVLDAPTLERALDIQRKSRSSLGDILIALGKVTPLDIARAISLQFQLPYKNMMEENPDPEVLESLTELMGESFFRKNSILPLERSGEILQVVTSKPNEKEPLQEIVRRTDRRLSLFVCSEREMQAALTRVFRESYIRESTLGLFYRNPEESAMETFTSRQLLLLYGLLSLFLFGLLLLGKPALGIPFCAHQYLLRLFPWGSSSWPPFWEPERKFSNR